MPQYAGRQKRFLIPVGQILLLLVVAFLVSRIPFPAGNQTASVVYATEGPSAQKSVQPSATPTIQEKCADLNAAVRQEVSGVQALTSQINGATPVETLQTRKELMLKLAKNNPQAFLCSVMNQAQKGPLSGSQVNLIEAPVTVSGKVTVIHGHDFAHNTKSTFRYQINQNGKTLDVYLDKEVPVLSGATVAASGYQLDNTIVASGGASTFQILASPTPTPQIGNKKIMVLLVNYLDSPPTPFTKEEIQNYIVNGNVQKLYSQASNQKISLSADAYGWYTVPVKGSALGEQYCYPFINPIPSSPAGVKSVSDIIKENNINVANYQTIMVMVNFPCPGIDGYSTIGATAGGGETMIINGQSYSKPFTWISSLPTLTTTSLPLLSRFEYVIAHELGHNLGVFHAGSWFCGIGQDPLYGADCKHAEYGNGYDLMGPGTITLDFNAAFKEFLGWVPPSNIVDITVPGRYTLNHLGDSTGFQIAKVRQPGTTTYPFYLEYRKAAGIDIKLPAAAQRGLFINWVPDDERSRAFSIYTRLLDATPNNDDFVGVTLNADGTFVKDSVRGIQIGPVISADENKIVFDVSFPSAPSTEAAKMTSPAAGAVLQPQTTFSWTKGTGVTEYWLGVASSLEALGEEPYGDIYAESTDTNTSVTVSNIPQNGAPIFVRLWSLINGNWIYVDYQYTASKIRVTLGDPATMTSPATGSTLQPQTTFSWTTGTGVTEYWLGVGTSFDAVSRDPWGDIYAQSVGSNTSAVVNIPTSGVPIYVRLWSLVNGGWAYVDYQYTASRPVVIVPPGATLSVSPSTARIGESIRVTFTQPNSPSATDWIGVYNPTTTDPSAFITWKYTSSCTDAEGAAPVSSGGCTFTIGTPGTYEFRLFSNDGFDRLTTSKTITITK